MRTIVIGFSKSKKVLPIGSWLIRMYQGFTEYSHVYIKIPVKPKFPSDKILHAAEGQVSHYSETAFLKRNEVVCEYEFEVSEEVYFELLRDYFHELSGEDYGVMQNVGIFLVDVFRKFNMSINNPFTKGWNCSEYVGEVLKKIFPNHLKYSDLNIITPKNVMNILEELEVLNKVKLRRL